MIISKWYTSWVKQKTVLNDLFMLYTVTIVFHSTLNILD